MCSDLRRQEVQVQITHTHTHAPLFAQTSAAVGSAGAPASPDITRLVSPKNNFCAGGVSPLAKRQWRQQGRTRAPPPLYERRDGISRGDDNAKRYALARALSFLDGGEALLTRRAACKIGGRILFSASSSRVHQGMPRAQVQCGNFRWFRVFLRAWAPLNAYNM